MTILKDKVKIIPVIPKMFEKMWQDFVLNILRFYTISCATLFYNLYIYTNIIDYYLRISK